MNAIAPLPSLIPESAPFSLEQRAWLNGFFAAYLGVNGGTETGDAAEPAEPEDFPWHDPTLSLAERLALAVMAYMTAQMALEACLERQCRSGALLTLHDAQSIQRADKPRTTASTSTAARR